MALDEYFLHNSMLIYVYMIYDKLIILIDILSNKAYGKIELRLQLILRVR